MASNMQKRLDKLQKQVEALGARDRQHHLVAIGPDDDIDTKTQQLIDDGTIKPHDTITYVGIPWRIRPLQGDNSIPDHTGSYDPYADPYEREKNKGAEKGASVSGEALDPRPQETWRDRERWAEHERRIEQDGQRYDPDKPKPVTGIY